MIIGDCMEKYTNDELQVFMKFINNQDQIKNLSKEELSKVSEIYKKARNNSDLKEILDKLTKDPSNHKKIIDEYLNNIDLSKAEDTVLAQIYDVDISEIEHKFLENGKEIINFYCEKLNRNIVFEKEKNGMTLKEQLKQAQEENEQFQSENANENTNNILENERIYGTTELKMIPVNKIGDYNYLIQKLSPEKITSLNYLVKNAQELHINSINIENVFGLTNKEYGSKIYEAYYDAERKKVVIEQPEETKNNKETEYHDEDEIRQAVEEMSSEEVQQVQTYRNYPELLESLPENNRRRYQQIIEQMEKNEAELNKPKVYTLNKNNNRSAGFVDAAILAFITEFVGLFFTTIVIIICSK